MKTKENQKQVLEARIQDVKNKALNALNKVKLTKETLKKINNE